MEESAERFLELLGMPKAPWRSLDIRTVAVQIGRRWTQLATRGYLDHRRPLHVDRLRPVVRPRLKAWQVVRPVRDVEIVARGFVEGCIRLPPRHIWIRSGSENSRHYLQYSFNELKAPYSVARYDQWSAHTLVGYGPQVWDLLQESGLDPQELDNIIRAGPNSYDGYEGLIRFFHGRPEPLSTQNSSSVFELVAPLAVRFDMERTSVARESISFGLRAASRDFIPFAELHWTAVGVNPPPHHGFTKLRDCEWRRDGAHLLTAVQVVPRDGDALVSAFLQHGQRCIDRVTLPALQGLGNRRIAAHAESDPELERFSTHLFPIDWKGAREFEQAVGTLLHFFGFQVDPLSSQKGAGAAVDHLAHDPLSDAIVGVECTVGPLETGKLGKLVARTKVAQRFHAGRHNIPCARVRTSEGRAVEDGAQEGGERRRDRPLQRGPPEPVDLRSARSCDWGFHRET